MAHHSIEFQNFSEFLGFKHKRNMAKSQWRGRKNYAHSRKAIKTADIEGKNWKQEMFTFLRNYRATPHSTTGQSPAEGLLGRKMRMKLSQLAERKDKSTDVYRNDKQAKKKMKQYADLNNEVRESLVKRR